MSQKEHGEVRSTSGTLKGVYHYLNSPSPHLFPFVFISNVTDSFQMFRVCKNGEPIAFPVLLPNQYKTFSGIMGRNTYPSSRSSRRKADH